MCPLLLCLPLLCLLLLRLPLLRLLLLRLLLLRLLLLRLLRLRPLLRRRLLLRLLLLQRRLLVLCLLLLCTLLPQRLRSRMLLLLPLRPQPHSLSPMVLRFGLPLRKSQLLRPSPLTRFPPLNLSRVRVSEPQTPILSSVFGL